MAAQVLTWDDFTGGYNVGPSHAKQPENTWRGHNVVADPNDGMLYPLMAWTAVTYSSGTPTAQSAAGGNVRMFSNAGTLYRIYDTSTSNTANIAKYVDATAPPTGVCAVTNTAISTCAAFYDAVAWVTDGIYLSFLPSSGTENYARWVPSTGTLTRYTIHANMRYLARFGEFMVGVALNGYRLFYTTAYDPTAWDAGDYYDIGDAGPITALVPFGDALYIAKADGWYVLTGVLGSSPTIRRTGEGYPGPAGGQLTTAVASPYGVLFSSPHLDCAAAVLNGDTVTPVNWAPPGDSGYGTIQTISPGLYAVGRLGQPTNVAVDRAAVWLLDARLGSPRWGKIEVPWVTLVTTTAQGNFAQLVPGATATYYQTLWVDNGVTIYLATPFPTREWWTSSAYPSGTGTVHLAPRRSRDPFTPRELYVEVCWTADSDSAPSVTAQVEVRGNADLPNPGRVVSTSVTLTPTVTATNPTHALYHDDRFLYATLRATLDTPAGTEVVPILTFTECKIRRVWLTDTSSTGRS